MNWITRLLSLFDRQRDAAERTAVALEDIASDLEGVRDQLRARLGGEKSLPPINVTEKVLSEKKSKQK